MFNLINRGSIKMINVLQQSKGSHLANDSTSQPCKCFGVILFKSHMSAKLRKYGFYPPPGGLEDFGPQVVAGLVATHGRLQLNASAVK